MNLNANDYDSEAAIVTAAMEISAAREITVRISPGTRFRPIRDVFRVTADSLSTEEDQVEFIGKLWDGRAWKVIIERN